VTAKKTWSDRFEGSLHPPIVEFNASIGFDIELIEYDLTGSIAHAKMLAYTGIITPQKQIVSSLDWNKFVKNTAPAILTPASIKRTCILP
jgi:argininosuccinate lyase